mmetsp:Transcript_6047/g.8945  ORF Transcript_6047/g.8945 Transcript_6047/m.8945 type:complete len:191 (+) Transcript_6047:50-622(+)
MEKTQSSSLLKKLAMYSVLVAFAINCFIYFMKVQNLVPAYLYTDFSSLDLALTCSALSTLPLMLMILTVMLCRIFTKAGNVLSTSNSNFFTLNKFSLQNTLEQTFLFVANLLAASSSLEKERIVILTCVFILARFGFWTGYVLSGFIDLPFLRSPGFCFTLFTNLILASINCNTFAKQAFQIDLLSNNFL